MSTYPVDSLSLAARVLVEWKTSSKSIEFQEVLAEILAVHPYAKRMGLGPKSLLFEYDERGSILWYLADTMRTSAGDPWSALKTLDQSAKAVKTILQDFLLTTHVGRDDRYLWDRGPLLSVVIEKILRGALRREPVARRSLLVLCIPLDLSSQRHSIERLEYDPWTILGKVSVRLSLFGGLFYLLGYLFLIVAAISSFWTVSALDRARSMLDILHALSVTGTASLIAIVFFSLVYLLTKPEFSQRFSKTLKEEINYRKATGESALMLSCLEDCIDDFLEMSSTELHVFAKLLRERPDSQWSSLALDARRALGVPVLIELLALLRSPEVDATTKRRLLRRLTFASLIMRNDK